MKKYLMMFFVVLTLGFQSCNNNDDLWNAIDDLKSRVQALETQVQALNGNVEALQQLYSGATITSVSKDAVTGTYTLKLSNGETVVLEQGSTAEAVIPQIGITADGEWQYSVDDGKTWKKLGVKANATDGKTPQFRIDDVTGYWQVRYSDTEQYVNVLDSNDKPVSAVGTGTVSDKFFEKVELDGDEFYVKLHDGTELRVPIVKDFECSITAPEGVQRFDAGATKRFAVVMKGVANAVVTAPTGWEARLTEANELVVTAPITFTRASADTSKDVAIVATSTSGFTAIAKIQVESSGVAPVAPTVSVVNSTTVEPTETSLTFDVTFSSDADVWKYLCHKSSLIPAPTAETIATTGTAGMGASVTVSGLEANTAYTIYVVAIKNNEPVLYSAVASVENTTKAVVVIEADYFQDYNEGKDVTIGTLVINKTTYPDAQSVKPSALTEDMLKAGGVIFIDNSDPTDLSKAVVPAAGTSVNAASTSNLVLIGRYKEKAQAKLILPEMRCIQNVSVKNLHLANNAGVSNMFTTSGGTKANPDVQVVDCTIDIPRYMFYDVDLNHSFLNVLIDNSIVKYPALTNQPSIFMLKDGKPSYPNKSIKITNSVLYAAALLQAHIINAGSNSAAYATTALEIEVSGNTLYNLYQPNIMIRAYILAGLTVTKNVGYYVGVTAKNYLTGVYDKTTFPADRGNVSYNYLYTTNIVDGTNFWSLMHTGSYTPTDNMLGVDLVVPFTPAFDVSKGYFPIDVAAVTNGAGAMYDTKFWFKAE